MADLRFEFLDVGQGDGTIIEFPNGKVMLIDFGSLKNRNITTKDAITYIKDYFPQLKLLGHLDYLVLTHGDQDHYNKIEALFKAIPITSVGELTFGGTASDYGTFGTGYLKKIIAMAQTHNEPTNGFSSPEDTPYWQIGGVNVWMLSANYPNKSYKDTNPKSIVLKFRYKSITIILMGDATASTEKSIIAAYTNKNFLSADIIKVAHHGSETSSSLEWIKATKPTDIYFSADMHDGYGLPRSTIVERWDANTKLDTYPAQHDYVCWAGGNIADGYWDARQTNKAILCSLSTANQGIQWEIRIDSNGNIKVNST